VDAPQVNPMILGLLFEEPSGRLVGRNLFLAALKHPGNAGRAGFLSI
jgi:hypothetical protein